MQKKFFTDCVDIVGSACKQYDGEKNYISTGAVDVDYIVPSEVEQFDYINRPSRANLEVNKGDILFAKMRGTKKTLLINELLAQNVYSTGFCAVRPKDGILTERCLYHLVSSETFLLQKDKNCSGATQKAITNAGLGKIMIKVPEYDSQEMLAGELDKLAKIIERRKSQLEKMDELIKARFVEVFGDPITNSKGWNIVSFDDCLDSIENGKSFVCDSNARREEKPAILKLSAVTNGVYKPDENKAILDEKDFVESAEVCDGDLLFTRKNTPELVGMAAYVEHTPRNLMMPDLVFRLNTKKECNKVYLWKLINHDLYRSVIMSAASGSAKSMSNISQERLGKIKLPLPPIEIQVEFADFVKQVDKSKFDERILCNILINNVEASL